jgi:hypothetical protein
VLESKIRIVSTGEDRTKDGEWREMPKTDGAREALELIKPAGLFVLPRIRKESISRASPETPARPASTAACRRCGKCCGWTPRRRCAWRSRLPP